MRLNTDGNLKLFNLVRACRTLSFIYDMTELDYNDVWIQSLIRNIKKEIPTVPITIPPEDDPTRNIRNTQF